MHLGIVCAMPMEARTLTRSALPRGQCATPFRDCTVICSGIGGANARQAVDLLLEHRVEAIVSWGCAGGLQPGLTPGTLVLPGRVLDTEGEIIDADPALHHQLQRALEGTGALPSGSAISSDSPVMSRQQKQDLHRRFGAAVVDMESAAMGLAARRHGLPFAVLRVVLDPAQQSLPWAVLAGLSPEGPPRLMDSLKGLARHPTQLLGLMGLAANAFRARRSLNRAATRLALSAER